MVYRVGTDIENELHCSAPQAIRIKHKQDIAGCCHPAVNPLCCACLCPVLKRRTINWIGENVILQNTPVWVCCTPCCNCCATVDYSVMKLLSSANFDPCCPSCGSPWGARGFATQEDMSYLLFCIPCECLYDLIVKPFCGEALWITPCENGTFCFKLGTRICPCFTYPMDCCMADSTTYRSTLVQQIASTRNLGLTAAQMKDVQKAAPPVQAIVRP